MGGALKNIYAIACGIADGLDSGENTIGMIMTRGLAEMSRLAIELGANPQTFLGLSGVGDLITTCASPISRNHRIGKCIGKGLTVEEAKKEIGQTTEGLKTLSTSLFSSDFLFIILLFTFRILHLSADLCPKLSELSYSTPLLHKLF